MERLTKRNEADTAYYYPNCFKECDGLGYSSKCNKCDFTYEVCEKLGEYEDAEEQGLLLLLPCGIGADIYFIPSETNFKLNIINKHEENNRVYHQKVKRVVFNEIGWFFECDKDIEYAISRIFIDKTYQKTWFLTQSEAEQKLKEMTEKDGH